mgnify:CR=1 FL=1
MKEYVRKLYKTSEMKDVLWLLENNKYHCFSNLEAQAIVRMFHMNGYRIVKVTE